MSIPIIPNSLEVCRPVSQPPVRIAFCITELDPGGAERALVRIVTGLNRQQWNPHVYCLAERGPLAEQLEAASVPVTCFGVRSRREMGVLWRLAKELRAFHPEILQTFMFHGNLAGRLAAWKAAVPVVVSGVRVVEPDAHWRMQVDRWTNRLVDRTICVSRAVADRYRELGFRDDQLAVVPNGVDVDRFATADPADLSRFGIPVDADTVISAGRLHPQKGQRDLLEAFDSLRKSEKDFERLHLLFVGDGPDHEQLAADVNQRGLTDRVHFAGWQPDIAPLLRAADCFVLSSRWEGMPNVLMEAMAAGLPCIATRVEGVDELIIPEETGLVANSGDVQTLAAQIERLCSDTSLAARLARAGQERVRDHFRWEQTIAGFESEWNRLIEARRR